MSGQSKADDRSESSQQALQKSSTENTQLLGNGEADLAAEHVVLTVGNFLEQLAVNIHQDPETRLTVFCDHRDQFVPGFVELTGAVGFQVQQRTKTRGIGCREQIRSRETELRQVFLGKVDASHGGVFLDVANDICKLECEAAPFGQGLGRGIAIAENVNTDQTDDRSYTVTIKLQIFEGLVLNRKACGGTCKTRFVLELWSCLDVHSRA